MRKPFGVLSPDASAINSVRQKAARLKFARRLKNLQPKVAKGGGDMDDALQLAETIERLAHYGQTCVAEEAVSIVSQVEVFSSMLRAEVDGFLVS